MSGYIYLLHFERPISPLHTCQHYIGWTPCLASRIEDHWFGRGANLTRVARERGIRFEVVRVWRGSRTDERRLKRWKNAPKLCPYCTPYPVNPNLIELSTAEIRAALTPF